MSIQEQGACVCCGAIIPEGRQVCRKCEDQNIELPQPSNSLMREMYRRLAAGKCMNNSVEWELCTMTDDEIQDASINATTSVKNGINNVCAIKNVKVYGDMELRELKRFNKGGE